MQKFALESFLSDCIPLDTLDPGLVSFLLTAPEEHKVLETDHSGKVRFALRERPTGDVVRCWPVPDLPGIQADTFGRCVMYVCIIYTLIVCPELA
jgi:hypothetical protein